MRGVLLDFDTLDLGDVETDSLEAELDHLELCGMTQPDAVVAQLADAEVAITNKVVLDAAMIEQLERVRLICIAATGTNNVDLAAARQRGIAVTNVSGYSTNSVVQHVFAYLLNLTTHMDGYRPLIREGRWQRSRQFNLLEFPVRELAGKTFGIIGYGTLGQSVEKVARALGMQVMIAERRGAELRPGRTPLETVIAQADVLSLHCPLNEDTHHLIGEAELAQMRPDAVLINTARGAVVDTAALAQALEAGRLGGAGVDVLPQEPPGEDEPLLKSDLPNLLITPHVAWAAQEARQRVLDEVAQNIRAFSEGRERNRVA